MAQSPSSPTKITVLISGSGTNLQALIDASQTPSLPNVRFTRVISDRKDAYGLQRAQAAGIPTSHHGILPFKKQHPDPGSPPTFLAARRAYDARLAELVLADGPDLVVCAGFMRIVTDGLLGPLQSAGVPIINLHPALHGDLVGAGCIERAWGEFVAGQRTRTGIMVHHVIAEVDLGQPIVQREVSIEGCASLEELQGRIHEAEHRLIVEGTRRVVEQVLGRKRGGKGQ
jgi:phosphoribosylglycinamide formyltransferase